MSQNLLSFLEGQLSADVVGGLATFLQVPEVQAGAAALAAQQALLVAMTQRATSPHGASELLAIVEGIGGDTIAAASEQLRTRSNLGEVARVGGPLASSLLAGSEAAVTTWLAGAVGIAQDTSRVLLGLMAPKVTHGVASYLTSNGSGVNASSVADLFGAEAGPLLANLPVGLAGALSVPSVSDLVRGPHLVSSTEGSRATGLEFVKWVLPLIAIVTVLVYVAARRAPGGDASTRTTGVSAPASEPNGGQPAPESRPVPSRSTNARAEGAADLGGMVDRAIPKQKPIRVRQYGIESKLLAVITDTNAAIDPTTSFIFDRLPFDAESATLQPGSNAQLDAVATILKAYPRVSLKIGGYTDNTGDDVANLRLSSARAEATKTALVSRGVAARRIDTEGFGARFPVASNATEEGRQRNRRIDARVTRK